MTALDGEIERAGSSTSAVGFEEALARLEAIVTTLEEGDLGLEQALGSYEAGIGLLKQCFGLLDKAERRIEQLCGLAADGQPQVMAFDDGATLAREAPPPRAARRGVRKTAEPGVNQDDARPGLF